MLPYFVFLFAAVHGSLDPKVNAPPQFGSPDLCPDQSLKNAKFTCANNLCRCKGTALMNTWPSNYFPYVGCLQTERKWRAISTYHISDHYIRLADIRCRDYTPPPYEVCGDLFVSGAKPAGAHLCGYSRLPTPFVRCTYRGWEEYNTGRVLQPQNVSCSHS